MRILLGAALAAGVFVGGAFASRAAAPSPNVIIVNIDDLGPAWLPPYAKRLDASAVEAVICRSYAAKHVDQGSFNLDRHLDAARQSMPFLDTLASRGAVFDWCFSTAPICAPSRAGLLTGRYQQRWGGYSIPDIQAVGIPANVPCLAEPFSRAGYLCGIIGKWHVGVRDQAIWDTAQRQLTAAGGGGRHPTRAQVMARATELGFDTSCAPGQNPLDKGFTYYFGYNKHSSSYYDADDLWENRTRVPKRPPGEYLTDLFNAKAAGFVEGALQAHRPFLLYYAPMAMHAKLVPPPAAYTAHFHTGIPFSDQYGGHLRALDEGIQHLFALLQAHGQDRNTLFVLTADNGASWEQVPPYNAPFRGGKGTGWLGGTHEPLIVYWPGHVRPMINEDLVSEMDIFPTALAAAGLHPPGLTDGRSLLPLLSRASAVPPHDRIFSASLHAANWSYPYFPTDNVRTRDQGTCPLYLWELTPGSVLMRITAIHPDVYRAYPSGLPARTLAFDLTHDLTESHDIYAPSTAFTAREAEMAEWLSHTRPPAAIHRADYETLRAGLGLMPQPHEASDLDEN